MTVIFHFNQQTAAMNQTQYHSNLDTLMTHIEDILDEADTDLDYVNNNGLLTITCESGVQIIISRQAPLLQLWVASPSGGMRFVYDQEQHFWYQDDELQTKFGLMLTKVLAQYTGESFDCKALDENE